MNDLELPKPIMFEWDSNNEPKIFKKHGINSVEAEQTFFHLYLIKSDEGHSKTEPRYTLLGITDLNQILFIVFTLRKNTIRIISARRADKKEKELYEQAF